MYSRSAPLMHDLSQQCLPQIGSKSSDDEPSTSASLWKLTWLRSVLMPYLLRWPPCFFLQAFTLSKAGVVNTGKSYSLKQSWSTTMRCMTMAHVLRLRPISEIGVTMDFAFLSLKQTSSLQFTWTCSLAHPVSKSWLQTHQLQWWDSYQLTSVNLSI